MKRERNERVTNNFLAVSQFIRNTVVTIIALPLFVLLLLQTGINAQAPANYMSCAQEGERCIFEGTKEVLYGARGGFARKTATNFIDCGVAGFGSDPAPNVRKQCYIPYQGSPVGNAKFTPCGKEGERCQFTGTREVMYGAGAQWATRGAANGVDCSVKVFGDPAPNVPKQCYVSTSSSGPGTRTFPDTYGGGPSALKPAGGTNYLKISTGGQGFFDIPQSTIVASPVRALKKGNKVVEYTLNNIPDRYLGYGTAIANMKFKPKAAIKDGILYVFITTGESSINVTKGTLKDGNGKAYNIFEDKPTARGYFLDGLKVVITADDNFEKESWGPKNVNEGGTITDMQGFEVGLSKDGPAVSYSFGSETTTTFSDFGFHDDTYSNTVGATWTLKKEIVVKVAGNYSSLNQLPALADSNFPVYEQAIFKARVPGYLPDTMTLNVQLKPTLRKLVLINNQDTAAQALFEGFVFLANPKFYSGELAYKLGESKQTSDIIYSITLDLTPLKK
ncbi:MAG TPA: hypothetical protein VFD58_07815 [Blastocatellia bacterium]|nr:hypothetical protein [Blastocatellia bacterium]